MQRAFFEPEAGAGDVRFGGVPLHRGERPSHHDTIWTFRRRFLKEIEGLFVQVPALARDMGMLKMGTVALDGTKIHANACQHSALSYEHAGKIET
jgi:transposase